MTERNQNDFHASMKDAENQQALFNAEFKRQKAAVRAWLKPAKGVGANPATIDALRALQDAIGPVRLTMGLHSLIFGGVIENNGQTYDGFEFKVDPDELLQEVAQYLIECENEETTKETAWNAKQSKKGFSPGQPGFTPYKRVKRSIRQTAKLVQRTLLNENDGFDGDSDYLV